MSSLIVGALIMSGCASSPRAESTIIALDSFRQGIGASMSVGIALSKMHTEIIQYMISATKPGGKYENL